MIHDTEADEDAHTESAISRRTAMKAAGVAGAASLAPLGLGSATAQASDESIDDALDTSGGLQEVLVVFTSNAQVDRLRHLDLDAGYHKFAVLPIGYTKLTGSQIEEVAGWAEVRYVEANAELEYHNDDAREVTGVSAVQSDLGYTGESVHSVVIDSGIDGTHPDHQENLVGHWRYVNPLSSSDGTTWIEAGDADTDDNGHGTHTSGTVAGDGSASDGTWRGMAPDADLTVYSAGLTLFIVKAVAAFDHVLARKQAGETDVQVVSNSYGSSGPGDFNPDGALEVATYESFEANVLPVFSAGNSGPETNTLNAYTKAPHVLGVAATKDDTSVTDFSSRDRKPSYDGETNYDRKKALRNLDAYYAADKTDTEVDSGSYSGTVGPAASAYHEWQAPSKAGYVEATLAWTPSAEDVDFYLHEGSKDGDVVASSATLAEPEELAGEIEGGQTYYFEVRPFANVAADYDVEYIAYEGIKRNLDPLGIYRNGVGAPGNAVMSTMNPNDPLQGLNPDDEPYYAAISGTSMSCPGIAGIATLVIDAARQNGQGTPDSIDVLNTIEAEAEDALSSYTPWNVGAGFVDAVDSVKRAEKGRFASFGQVDLVDY